MNECNYVLDYLRTATPTVLMNDASDRDIQELWKELHRWQGLASREIDQRIRRNQEEAASV